MAIHMSDSPCGLTGYVEPGISIWAQATNAVIVPVFIKAEKTWYFTLASLSDAGENYATIPENIEQL